MSRKRRRRPHEPSGAKCAGSGSCAERRASLVRDQEMDIPGQGAARALSVRRQAYSPPPSIMLRDSTKTYVYYTILVNGDSYASRNRVRLRMIDDRETHLYYSKVQVSFHAA